MRNNVPKLQDLKVFDPKQIIMELDVWHYFNKPPTAPPEMPKEIHFDPSYYYITSGEAIEKTNYMVLHLDEKLEMLINLMAKSVMGALHIKKPEAIKRIKAKEDLPKSIKSYITYYDYMVDSKSAAKSLIALLKKFRGKNCFLETEWDSHRLLCISKNPRMKEEVEDE